jgi:hypothetical protein
MGTLITLIITRKRRRLVKSNVRALKLDEEAFNDEQKMLWSLKNELRDEFGFCLWDKMMAEEAMDLEELYDYYCQEKMRRNGLDI